MEYYHLINGRSKSCGCLVKPIDFTDQRINKLVVVELIDYKDGYSHWKCKCDCGNIVIRSNRSLSSKGFKSCGCHRIKSGRKKWKHYSLLYGTWNRMKRRCFDRNNPKYKNYGGRGISVCSNWMIYKNFEKWALMNGYVKGLSIDRINNDRNYEPDNCRWITVSENSRHRKNTKLFMYKEKKYCLRELAEKYAVVCTGTVRSRIYSSKWNLEEALFTPRKK